jgi:hypothetical protein
METQHGLPELPLCPSCANLMLLARTWPRVGGLPEMLSFECKRCRIVFTEVVTGDGSAPERASALHDEAYHALQ